MTRCEKAVENHKMGCNCAQAVACVFADELGYSQDVIFRLTEGFGAGMGATQGVCGAVSAMVFVAGALKSFGIDKLPDTNKKTSYDTARSLMERFAREVGTTICAEIKAEKRCSCNECIEKAVKILEENLF